MTDLEESLRRTLGRAAEQAPPAPTTLSTHVEGRYRRRRRRGQALLAAAAVVVVAGGAAFALRPGPATPAPVPAANPTTVASVEITTSPPAQEGEVPPPIEEVWPQAVRKIPAKLPDGATIRPVTFIDDHTLLVTTWSSFEKTNALLAYDLDSGQTRLIADLPEESGEGKMVLFPSDFTVGEGQIAWWTAREVDGGQEVDLWAVPVTGGEARKVTSVTGPEHANLDPIAIAGDKIAFSFRQGGVHTVPLAGGAAQPVSGGEGLHLLSWPWIGNGGKYGSFGKEVPFKDILNVETGQRDTALVNPGETMVACGLTMCTGGGDDGSFHRKRDGSGQAKLPGGFAGMDPPVEGRFLTSARSEAKGATAGASLHDLRTGASADLGVRPDKDNSMQLPGPGPDNRIIAYRLKDEYVVVDLTKIP